MRRVLTLLFWFILIGFALPVGISAALHYAGAEAKADWRTADRSSAGLLEEPLLHSDSVIRIYAARTVRWRSIFAVHCWLVYKAKGASAYTRYDYTAWTELPVRMNGYAPDGRWFGRLPETVYALDGEAADLLIPKIEEAILDAVPEIDATLPALAIGKDFPYDGKWLRPTADRAGFRLSVAGYAGLT